MAAKKELKTEWAHTRITKTERRQLVAAAKARSIEPGTYVRFSLIEQIKKDGIK